MSATNSKRQVTVAAATEIAVIVHDYLVRTGHCELIITDFVDAIRQYSEVEDQAKLVHINWMLSWFTP